MKFGVRTRGPIMSGAAVIPVVLLDSGIDTPSLLRPHGSRSDQIATMFWILLGVGSVVFVLVMVGFLIGALRPSRRVQQPDARSETRTVSLFGILLPAIVLIAVFGYTLWTLRDLAKPASAGAESITVVGHRWWWEVDYGSDHFSTANEIHIPTGKRIDITVTSDDVIHSFWVPQLSDKIDMIPGHTNHIWLEADTPGEYRGQCAEFCGAEHADMAFLVVADTPAEYTSWVASQQQPAPSPASSLIVEGQQVYFDSACVYCHTIAGTTSSGKIGPDLTHLASRKELAAGTIPNTPGNLAGWITNPQSIKPNNEMPAISLSPAELQALIAYLESLK